ELGKLVYVAPQVERVFGLSVDELSARGGRDSVHPDDRDAVGRFMASLLASDGAVEQLDYRLQTPARGVVYVRSIAALARAGARRVIRGVSLDITAQTRLESELRQAQKLESVGRLAAGVAHEINTPVQFVSDSLVFVKDAARDLLGLMA